MQTLLFSDQCEQPKAVNVASVPQRSPFRYPGGKTWFVPRLREWLQSQTQKPALLVEPFVGGGIVSLTAVMENFVDRALMVELDQEIAAVWQTIVDGDAEWLADRIQNFELTRDTVDAVLGMNRRSVKERAFQTIIKNRTNHGGILAAGTGTLRKGEAGKGISSRWYPATLAKRLKAIDHFVGRFSFMHCDAFEVIEAHSTKADAVFFIDPPYTAGGKKAGSRLYTHHALDHEKLFRVCSRLEGDFIMTYDNAPEVKKLAKEFGFQAKPISMKNTHHAEMTELVIGRDLDWMMGIDRLLEEQAVYNATSKRFKKTAIKRKRAS
jgi:DNA adenine methylase